MSFVVTPLCSNASELVSSLIFAAKKKKENISMTFAQVKLIVNEPSWTLSYAEHKYELMELLMKTCFVSQLSTAVYFEFSLAQCT